MSNLNVYSLEGSNKTVTAPKNFNGEVNMALISQALRVYEDRLHPGLAKVKTRGEVRLSTRKIYRQKGTGGARHGAKSANLFVGGGVTHGPTGIKRVLTLPKNMKSKALISALSLKAKKDRVALVTDLAKVKKTKDAKKLVEKIVVDQKLDSKIKFTLVLSAGNKDAKIYFKNLKLLQVVPFENLNVYKVFYGGYLLFDAESFPKVNPVKKEIKTTKTSTKKAVKNK
jgi:large subunit ribosomal protein L4